MSQLLLPGRPGATAQAIACITGLRKGQISAFQAQFPLKVFHAMVRSNHHKSICLYAMCEYQIPLDSPVDSPVLECWCLGEEVVTTVGRRQAWIFPREGSRVGLEDGG